MKTKDIAKTIEQGREQVKKLLWWGGENAFPVFFAFLFLAALLAGLVFAWSTLAPQQGEAPQSTEVVFEKQLFKQVLGGLEQKKERLKAADALESRDLFSAD